MPGWPDGRLHVIAVQSLAPRIAPRSSAKHDQLSTNTPCTLPLPRKLIIVERASLAHTIVAIACLPLCLTSQQETEVCRAEPPD